MDIVGDNFVVVRGPDPVSLLRTEFSEFFAGVGFHIDDDEPYLAYETFANHLHQRRTDQALWARAVAFFNGIALNHPLLHELLSVAVFEPLFEDNDVVMFLKANLNPTARMLVEEIERHRQRHRGVSNVSD
ncbi:MAG: hypothetical protein JST93_08810 [Acidobacteria bacterium]|nr:hypothetical protein [Acidobacteriota bacterium]